MTNNDEIAVDSITVVGRRWFNRNQGNTYHSAEILVNGLFVHKTPYEYGYGGQYEETAAEWLEKNGFMPGRERHANTGGRESLGRYCERHDVAYSCGVTDVSRKKDL
jgi:hypothetical protein